MQEFDLPELKLLIDAAQSSRLITEKKKCDLSKKLARLASVEQAKELDRNTGVNDRAKSTNAKQSYTLNTITKTINIKKESDTSIGSMTERKGKISATTARSVS